MLLKIKSPLFILALLTALLHVSCKKDNYLELEEGSYIMETQGSYTYQGDEYETQISYHPFIFHESTKELVKLQFNPDGSQSGQWPVVNLVRSENKIYAGDGDIGMIYVFMGDGEIVNNGVENIIQGELVYKTTHCCDFSGPQPLEVDVWVDGTYEFYPY